MENSFTDRIEPDIHRGEVCSVDDELRKQLERWLEVGVPPAEEPADRFTFHQPDS